MDSCSFAPFSFDSFTKVPPFAAEEASAPAPTPFKLIVKTPTGCVTVLDVTSNSTIKDVKDLLADPRLGAYQNSSLRIIVRGKQAEDSAKLADFDMSFTSTDAERTVHAILRIRGGMFHPTSSRADFDPLERAPCLVLPVGAVVRVELANTGSAMLEHLRKRLLEEGIMEIEFQIRLRRMNTECAPLVEEVVEPPEQRARRE
jgi:hypothetical protein